MKKKEVRLKIEAIRKLADAKNLCHKEATATDVASDLCELFESLPLLALSSYAI